MNCKVCGSSEFVTNDGITFCTECQSQIEETQTEVAVGHILSRDIGSSKPKKALIKKKQEYSDWITVEGFNHILYMQVSSLINLGASPKLKTTVLHIWSKYLQRCEIAFRIDYQTKDGQEPLLGTTLFKRDLKNLYGNKQISKRKRKKPEESDTEFENPSTDEGPPIEDEDAKSDTDADISVKAEDKVTKPKFSSFARKILRKKRPRSWYNTHKQIFNLTLAKTLSICYLGLLYTEDPICLSDLIRFVYEEKVPYVNLCDKMPSTLKLHSYDNLAFLTYTVPDAYTIQKTSRKIMHFIKLPEYKKPSICLVAARLIKDLNLPGDMLPIVKQLTERYKEQISHYVYTPKIENAPIDYQALAFILVAMKMLFVLDDKFEIEHSEVMKKLNALHPDRKYFVWKEWKEHSVVKEFLFLYEKPGFSTVNNLDNLSANLIISKYPFIRLRSTSPEEPQNHRDIVPVKYRISKVLSDLVHIPSSNSNGPTSFPLRRDVKCFMKEWMTLPMFRETKEIDFTLLGEDFTSCSLFFHPSQFDEMQGESSRLLMTSLYLPDTWVHLGSKYDKPVTYHHKLIYTTSSYWFFYFSQEECGQSDLTSAWFDKLPNSFKWLVNFFSKYSYCNITALCKEVYQIEKFLFLQKAKIPHNVLYKYKNKMTVDF